MSEIDVKNAGAKEWLYVLVLSLIKTSVYAWDLLTLPIYSLFGQVGKKRRKEPFVTVEILHQNENSLIYRSLPVGETASEIGSTLVSLIEFTSNAFPQRKALGTRRFLGFEETLSPEGETLIKHHQGEYEWITYKDVHTLSSTFSRGLRSLGSNPGGKVLIFAESSAKWLISAFGSFKNSMTLITIYTNLGDEGVLQCLDQQRDARLIITSEGLLKRLLSILAPLGETIQTVIVLEKGDLEPIEKDVSGIKIIGFNDVLKLSYHPEAEDEPRVKPSDIAVIMYTSGSTGLPKGVLLSHFNIMSNIQGITHFLNYSFHEVHKQMYIGYLPLAHIFELCVEIAFFGRGIPIGFSDPRTLMDSSPLVKEGHSGDISVLKPTYMAMVPLVAERIRKVVHQRISEKGELLKRIFNVCYEYKSKWRRAGQSTPLMNYLFFRRFKQLLGGKLELIASGGAPLSPRVREFMEIVFDLRLREGYGLTETSGGFMMGGVGESSAPGEVGIPFLGPCVKLIDWEEGEYSPSDKPNPRGEIHVGGNLIAEGYYENNEESLLSFYEENGTRWFRTGDIGQLMPSCALKIVDRKKDIVKLQNGEYVPLGKVEAHLKTHPLVESVCAYGESQKNNIVALLIPNWNTLKEHLLLSEMEEEQILEDASIRRQVEKILTEHSEKSLRKYEIPRGFYLIKGPWTPENGLLTSSFKLRRKAIQIKYQDYINKMYMEF